MKTEEEIKSEILDVHDLFWKALGDRDPQARFLHCIDNVTFIGTGLNEKATGKEEYIAINKRGIEQYPRTFKINFLWKQVSYLSDTAWVESEVEWDLVVDGKIEKEMIRNTVILKKINDLWKIVHVHGSVPDYRYTGENYMTNEDAQKRNRELEMEVYKRTRELNQALEHLKNTQTQLIQSEKMASLGELTAGIAHEIQNPLNFVNNFSEVNNELIEELKSQKSKLKSEEQDEILNDIFQNNEKINHHGKRADAIVKGMLQHSRSSSSGQKEPTDINALCDEYLRLSYHGLRAKDKSFNATLKTDFDPSIGKINIIPQDIGRVLLNLLNNAFYACFERSQSEVDEKKKVSDIRYQPTVTVSTASSPLPRRGVGGEVIIKIQDNGNGIPQNIIDKIFQPFFTSKPTGQGTGLGLSLSYDIITKLHSGKLTVETKEGVGTTFIIQLPDV